jgi:hypothetical protein
VANPHKPGPAKRFPWAVTVRFGDKEYEYLSAWAYAVRGSLSGRIRLLVREDLRRRQDEDRMEEIYGPGN